MGLFGSAAGGAPAPQPTGPSGAGMFGQGVAQPGPPTQGGSLFGNGPQQPG